MEAELVKEFVDKTYKDLKMWTQVLGLKLPLLAPPPLPRQSDRLRVQGDIQLKELILQIQATRKELETDRLEVRKLM